MKISNLIQNQNILSELFSFSQFLFKKKKMYFLNCLFSPIQYLTRLIQPN